MRETGRATEALKEAQIAPSAGACLQGGDETAHGGVPGAQPPERIQHLGRRPRAALEQRPREPLADKTQQKAPTYHQRSHRPPKSLATAKRAPRSHDSQACPAPRAHATAKRAPLARRSPR
jgi:hypothetical protein